MDPSTYVIKGRITRKDTGGGVHGLLVEAWDEDVRCDDCLGHDLTNSDGSFFIAFKAEDFKEPFEGNPEVYLKIYDRDCRPIYDTRSKKRGCSVDLPLKINLSLAPETLWWHLSKPLSWECPEGALVSQKIYDEIQEAIAAFSQSKFGDLKAVFCATPIVDIFDRIVQEAWDTLQGDLDAAARYRDILEALCACKAGDCCCENDRCYERLVEDLFEEMENASGGKKKKKKKKPCSPCLDKEPDSCRKPPKDDTIPCPCKPSLISNEKAATLIMGALHVSCGHVKTAKKYILALLDQLCRFEFLGALHRSAIDALCGNDAAQLHFQDLLEFIRTKCEIDERSDIRSINRKPLCCCETCLDDDLERCVRDAIKVWCEISCYTVTKIEPARACVGDEIVICGEGFGSYPGVVVFRQKGSIAWGPIATPDDWCDDQIRVTVPQGAGCGLTLRMPANTQEVCNRFLEYRPHGCFKAEFEGTSAEILAFSVEGRQEGDCLEPGEPLRICWKTCAADRVTVEIINTETNAVIGSLDPADARGCWNFTETDFDQTTPVRIVVTAQGQCEPAEVSRDMNLTFQRPADLSIDGLEITQAIQYYRASEHLTDATDRGPDNSVQLVASKRAWVRTYLRSGQDPTFDNGMLTNVDGTMQVERRVNGIWSVVANINSDNGPITAFDSFGSYNAERRDINATLNFVVPANVMTGLLRFTVRVSSADDCYEQEAQRVLQVDVDLDQELRIAAVAVGYDGPPLGGGADVTFAAPTNAQIAAEAGYALAVYPVRATPNIRNISTVDATQPLDDNTFPAGGCDPNWTPIMNQVANARTNDGNQAGWIYYGFVTSQIPISHGNVGCANGGGNAAGLLGTGTTFAHEVGHQTGLNHAPCGAVGTVTPGHPLYEPYDTGVTSVNMNGDTVWSDASIGEYGLDVRDGTIFNPNPVQPNNGKDLMGYCGNRWVSLFTHDWMINNANLNPVALATGTSGGSGDNSGSQQGNVMRPFITMIGSVTTDGSVEVSSVARIPTRELTPQGRRTEYRVELIDENGNIAASAPAFTLDPHDTAGDCGCGGNGGRGKKRHPADPPFSFIAAMPDVTEGNALRVTKDEEVVWERRRPSVKPAFSGVRASVKENQLVVSWDFEVPPGDESEVWLRWSEDGKLWNGLAIGLHGNEAVLDATTIRAKNVYIQAYAHDGFFSVDAQSEPVALPDPVVGPVILHPKDGQRFEENSSLHLWGTLTGVTPKQEPAWYLDQKKVGSGLDVSVKAPGPGEHVLELRAGGESASIQFFVEGEPPTPKKKSRKRRKS